MRIVFGLDSRRINYSLCKFFERDFVSMTILLLNKLAEKPGKINITISKKENYPFDENSFRFDRVTCTILSVNENFFLQVNKRQINRK